MQQVVGVQTPLLLVKATAVAVCCGCAFTQIILWRQHLLLYVVAVHSPRLYCEGNICDRGCEFTHTLLWRQHPWPYFVGVPFWVTHTPLWRQHRWLYTVVVHLPILSLKLFSLAMCGQTWHHECVYRVNVCLCKHFHVGLQQRKKENKWIQKTGVIRNSAPIFLSLAIAHSVTHSHACAHTYCQMGRGSDFAHKHMKPAVGNPLEDPPPPPPPPHTHTHHETEGCPLTPIQPLSLAWSTPLANRCTGHSFLFTCVCVCRGEGGSSYIFRSSLASPIPLCESQVTLKSNGVLLNYTGNLKKSKHRFAKYNTSINYWKLNLKRIDCSRSALMSRTSKKSELFLFSTSFWDIFRCKGSQFLNM